MIRRFAIAALFAAIASPLAAQLSLPTLPDPGDSVGGTLGQVERVLDDGLRATEPVLRSARELARARTDRLAEFVRRNRAAVEFDDQRQPARRGEAILLDPDAASIAAARAEGYNLIEQGEIEALGIPYARLALHEGEDLAKGIRRLRKLLPGKSVTADQLHFTSGAAMPTAVAQMGTVGLARRRGGTVGIIDGGAGAGARIAARRGFASGAPKPDPHGAAIASLLAGAGVDRIWSADVYGSDPAGGSALTIARALGWLTGEGIKVVSISLAGPANPLLEKAVAAARGKGVVVVAAVGNDGPAAPPAYPASYPGVIAVTGVDARGRILIEAGKAGHLDYAAPGAGLSALDDKGKRVDLRGTSFAAPLAAARIAAHLASGTNVRSALAGVDAEAEDLGRKGPDDRYGRGLVCGACRRGI